MSFFQAFVYLLAAVISVPLAKRLGLGSVLGYLLGGIVIGSFGLQLVGAANGDVMAHRGVWCRHDAVCDWTGVAADSALENARPDRQSRWRTSARHGRVRVRPGNLARSPLADGGYGWVTPTCLS